MQNGQNGQDGAANPPPNGANPGAPPAPQVVNIPNAAGLVGHPNHPVQLVMAPPRPAPTKFTASKGQEIRTFLDKLLSYAENENWPVQNLAAYALDFLDDEPYCFARDLPVATRQDWDRFKAALIERFDRDSGPAQVTKVLSGQIKQKDDEDILDFEARVLKECRKVFANNDATDSVMLSVFTSGVRPQYKKRLMDSGPQTLAAAVNIARNLESSDSATESESKVTATPVTVDPDAYVTRSYVEQLVAQTGDLSWERYLTSTVGHKAVQQFLLNKLLEFKGNTPTAAVASSQPSFCLS